VNHQENLSLAAREAHRGIKKGDGGPFGAMILNKNKILALTHNTVLKTNDPTCHAEINAIRKACKKLKKIFLADCVIYSTTEPCPMCFSAIHWAQLRQIIYCSSISDVKRLGFNELNISNQKMKRWGKSRVTIIKLENKDCRKIFSQWKKLQKKQVY